MGLFDLFKSKAKEANVSTAGPAVDKNLARIARVAGDKRAQNYDRMEAIQALSQVPTADAAAGLLRRFTFHIDPSITDQEEKDAAVQGILNAGDAAVEPISAFCLKAESLTWPLKILKQLVPADRYRQELIGLLGRFDTEYTRNVDPKQQLIAELEQYPSTETRLAVERFLEDVNEVVRFVAVTTVFAQEDSASVEPLVATLVSEESVRVKNRISEGLASRQWAIPEASRNDCASALPAKYVLDANGIVRSR
jgi:hypothetical protein